MKIAANQKIWRWLPGAAISLAALIVLAYFINFENLIRSIRSYSAASILLIVVLIIIPLFFRALAWKSLLRDISFRDSFLTINEGYLLNNLIPRSGEIARIFLVKGMTKISAFHVSASIIFERGLDVIFAAGLFLSTLPMVVVLGWLRTAAITMMILFCFMLTGMVLVAIYAMNIERWLEKSKAEWLFFKQPIKPLLIKGIQGLAELAKPKALIFGVFWIICSWAFWVGLLFFVLRLINPDAPVWWAIFVEGMLALGIALPSAPANLGVYEGTMVIAFSILGLDENTALSTAIIIHTLQILVTSVIGIIGFSIHGLKIREIMSTISNRLMKKEKEMES